MKTAELSQVTQYGNVTVQRYDIGVPEFSVPLSQRADIVFCNDATEHVPYKDIPAFIEDLESAGKYVIMYPDIFYCISEHLIIIIKIALFCADISMI